VFLRIKAANVAKLLLVEDDNNLREIYQARLSAEGYDIVAAQNGEEALSVAKQHRPDLIISDVMMPRISGFEMLDILRGTPELASTKVIMLTALGQAEDQARAGKLGADKYLVKSQVTLEDIVNCARDLLNGTTVVAPNPDQTPALAATDASASVTPAASAPASYAAVDQPVSSDTAPIADPAPTVSLPPVQIPADPMVVPPPNIDAATPTAPPPVPAPSQPVDTSPSQPASPPLVVTTVQDPDPLAAPVVQVTDTLPPPTTDPLQIVTHKNSLIAQADVVTPAETTTVTPEPTAATPPLPPQAVTPADVLAPGTPEVAAQQTLAAKEADIESQIAAFANAQTDPPVVPSPPVTDTQSVAASNEAALTAAVEDLTAAVNAPQPVALPPSQKTVPGEEATVVASVTPEQIIVEPVVTASTEAIIDNAAVPPLPPIVPTDTTSPQVTAPEGAAAPSPVQEESSDQVNVAGKKVIRPINDINHGPNLEDLLAKEVAKEAATGVPPATVAVTTPQDPAQPAATAPPASDDPNSIAL
jgi:CheY-like chemotaxis protein